ncbi:hypothetical protein HN011_004836 [Eciton burchellii]|nr:hypothetical protein HN011_004836 [Eciton burchellii]
MAQQQMGHPWVQEAKLFWSSRMDYAEPIWSYGNQDRSFGADFFSTAFIKALRQFVVIRECCTRLYNDNGINFRDAERELREMFRAAPNFYEGCRSELDKGIYTNEKRPLYLCSFLNGGLSQLKTVISYE